LLFIIPFLIFVFNIYVVDRSDTRLHENIHAKICNEFYNGTPKINYFGVFGNDNNIVANTECYNSTARDNALGRELDYMNEIENYNSNSIKIYLNMIIFWLALLVVVIMYVTND